MKASQKQTEARAALEVLEGSEAEHPRDRADALVDQIQASADLLVQIGISTTSLEGLAPLTLATVAAEIMERCRELSSCLAALNARERELAAAAR